MQAQLLRVLQEGEVRRVGGSSVIKIDARVISATNRDLAVEVADGRMRLDLFYRLNVVSLHVPPLRERGEDLTTLTDHLVSRHAALLGRPPPHISDEAMRAIRAYAWPGNVRELENALARAVAMSERGIILPGDLPALTRAVPVAGGADGEGPPPIDGGWPTLELLQRRYIDKVLAHAGHNKTAAAQILGIDRRTIQRLAARQDEGGEEDQENDT